MNYPIGGGEASKFASEVLKKIFGETRKYKMVCGSMYISLGDNKVARADIKMLSSNYRHEGFEVKVFDKNNGFVDSLAFDFSDICPAEDFGRDSYRYTINEGLTRWDVEPDENSFRRMNEAVNNYLEIFETGF